MKKTKEVKTIKVYSNTKKYQDKELDEKLNNILKFLGSSENRKYNEKIHRNSYIKNISWQQKKSDIVLALLHDSLNTQQSVKLNETKIFWERLFENQEKLNSFKGFLDIIIDNDNKDYKGNESMGLYKKMFYALDSWGGWGPKTSALFVKKIGSIMIPSCRLYRRQLLAKFAKESLSNKAFF